jgi:hypothetical protein
MYIIIQGATEKIEGDLTMPQLAPSFVQVVETSRGNLTSLPNKGQSCM